jgi:hypothetical protein
MNWGMPSTLNPFYRGRVVSMLSIFDDISAIYRFYRISVCVKNAEVYYNKITEEDDGFSPILNPLQHIRVYLTVVQLTAVLKRISKHPVVEERLITFFKRWFEMIVLI